MRRLATVGPVCVLAFMGVPASGLVAHADRGEDKEDHGEKRGHDRGDDARPEPGPPPDVEPGPDAGTPTPPEPAAPEGNSPGRSPAPTPPARPRCPNATARPGDIGLEASETALLCVINDERRERGLAALHPHPRLETVAVAHSRDMVRRRYFSHHTKGGAAWNDRLKSGGYTTGASHWRIGETLAWTPSPAANAHETVRAWLNSKPHRKVMLQEEYRDIGIGIVFGTPDGVAGATFTADYGRVR